MSELKRRLVNPKTDQKVFMAIGQEAAEKKLTLLTNYDGQTLADGVTLAIVPQMARTRRGEKMSMVGLTVARVPSLSSIRAHARANEWIDALLTDAIFRRVASRASAEDASPETLPVTAEDIFVGGGNLDLAGWRKYGKLALDAIRSANPGLANLTLAGLRSILESADYARSVAPNVPQARWEKVTARVIELCEAGDDGKTYDTSFARHWLATRERSQAVAAEDLEIDF